MWVPSKLSKLFIISKTVYIYAYSPDKLESAFVKG